MSAKLSTSGEVTTAATVAPEDLRPGQYVAILNEIVEYPAYLWDEPCVRPDSQRMRVQFCALDGGLPLKVKSICLPFIFASTPTGTPHVLDVRQVQLVRLKKKYAKAVRKAMRRERRRRLHQVSHSR